MNNLWNSLRMFLWMTLVTGIAYPLMITGIAQLTMKHKADGDFLSSDGKMVGAKLIAQKFESDLYFWGRPSSVDYNPIPSGASNFGPTSAALKKAVDDRKEVIVKAHGISDSVQIPSELLFASGSGLDPHISPATANFQIDRVIKARKLDAKSGRDSLVQLITQLTENRCVGFIGEPRVNVLKLNIALDELFKTSKG